MNCTIREVTPAAARYYLTKNNNNRKLRQSVVDTYADDMVNGRWETNAQPIVFNSNGELLDGQHRLSAIIKAGIPVEMMIITGAPDSKLYDVGLKRTDSDILRFKDNNNTGFMYSTYGLGIIRSVINRFTGKRVSVNAIEDFINSNKSDLEHFFSNIIFVLGGSTVKGIRSVCVPAAMWLAHKNGVPDNILHNFYKVFTTGISTDEYDIPTIVLRNKFIADYRNMTNVEKVKRTMWTLDKLNRHVVTSTTKCPTNFIYSVEV